MLRVSLTLEIDPDFPDSDSDTVVYVRETGTVATGSNAANRVFVPWFRITPEVIAWLGELLTKAAKSVHANPDSTAEDRFEIQRMRRTHDELVGQFGVAAKGKWKAPEYYSSDECKAIDDFCASRDPCDRSRNRCVVIPGPKGNYGKPTSGTIIVWRPKPVSADGGGSAKVLGGVRVTDDADVSDID